MNMKRILILGLLLIAALGRAQITDSGWFRSPPATATTLPPDPGGGAVPATASAQSPAVITPTFLDTPGASVAELVTPDIQALADGLQDDPLKIFNYVHDHIRHVLYFGSKKGANLTLLEKSGNDFDQSALLVALLRAAGYTNAQGSNLGVGYQFGWELLPYDSPDHQDLHHWLGLNLNNTNWNYTTLYLFNLFYVQRGYPTFYYSTNDANTFWFQRVWVTLTIGSTNYYLDPAFKVSEPIPGLTNLAAAMGFNSNSLMSAAGGTDGGYYVTNLSEINVRNLLAGYTTNLLGYLQSNYPNASVSQILSGQAIVPSTATTLATNLLFPYYEWNQPGANMPVVNWQNEPTNLMSTLTVSLPDRSPDAGYEMFMPQLQGQRLSLVFSSTTYVALYLDDTPSLYAYTSGGLPATTRVVLAIQHPIGTWDFANNALIPNYRDDQIVTNVYQNYNATYAILYAFEPDWGWLQERQNKLNAYIQQGATGTNQPVLAETLNVMGLNWMLQTEAAEQLFASQMGILPQYHHRFGRMAQEKGLGYYVDVYAQTSGEISNSGEDAANGEKENREFALNTYFGSALEHGLIEQMQNTNMVGASTIKMLQLANSNGLPVYLANKSNWSTGVNIQSKLTGYAGTTLAAIGSQVSAGYEILIPKNGLIKVTGGSGWAGYGYEAALDNGTNAVIKMAITGNYYGGYSGTTVPVNTDVVQQNGNNQPSATSLAAPMTIPVTAGDPVDTANGTFQVERTALSLGQAEPRGITLSHYYNGTRRYSNPAGMAYGWTHNYIANAKAVAAPQASLGGTTPAQAAPMIVATCAALGIFNDLQPDPKNWMVTALIAKWGIDQITAGGVTVNLGKDTLQFVKQPNGVYTPPANCKLTLARSGSNYSLQQRHGNTFNFDGIGRLSNIIDPYNQNLTVNYLSSTSSLPSQVTDSKGRQLTFSYSPATGGVLSTVTDNTGRSVHYVNSTTFNPQGDLLQTADPAGFPTSYAYDGSYNIISTTDEASHLVTSNRFDSFGHVTTQYSQGDPNKTWRFFWSGYQMLEQDPTGGQRRFSYDDQGRLTSLKDQLGNLSQSVYDGQNHVIATISPLNETNRVIYDGNHNVLATIDPLGFSNQFFYDGQFNLIRTLDALRNPTTFGYNTNFSLTGTTNGMGDWVSYSYNADGTLTNKLDPGGSTGFTYDGFGQLNSITYPGSLGSEGFLNSGLGDVLSHTNGRGFVTSFQYNSRRQLTNTLAPTNLTASANFDAVGNQQSSKDARGFVTTSFWSPTRHSLGTALPATPQGTPATTNFYDSRDWLIKTLDPLQQPSLFTNDLAGRLISATDPLLRKVTFGFDADGRKLATTNAAQEVTRQQWSARGEATNTIDNAGHTVPRAFDGAGNQVLLTNRKGKAWQFYFDAANRLTNTITPLGRSSSLAFNNRGLVVSTKDPAGQTTTLNYDAKGRLTNRVDGVASTLFNFDGNNNLTNIIESGGTNSWSFDAYDRVSSYKDADGNLIQYRYDNNGNITNLIYPGGKTVTYAFDSLNRLTNVTDWAGRKTALTYDLASRLTSLTRPNGTLRTIGYDAAGETTNIVEQAASKFPIAFFKLNWDAAARVAWEFAGPLPHPYTLTNRNMAFDDDNRMITFNGQTIVNDLDGNMTSGPLTNNSMVSYAFDGRNRLLSAGGLNYSYDPAGNRTSITNGATVTQFVINPNARLPQTLMRIKSGVTNYYVYGAGLLYQVTETAAATNTLTYHFDYRGSTVALTDDSGNITDHIEYSAYASITYRLGTNDTPFLYNGRYGVQTDLNGLLYMRARYYNPYLCRFVNQDPSGFSGGLNFYAAFNGNPVSLIDPFGLGAVVESGQLPSWVTGPQPNYSWMGADVAARAAAAELYQSELLSLISAGIDYNPHVQQLPEPSASTLLLTGLGMVMSDPALGGITRGAAESGAARLNIFGESEARGFLDVSPNAQFANGRPLTSSLGNGSASDIFIRNAPITSENTISEIMRLSQPGTRVTLMQPASGFQGQALIDAFGNNASVNFIRTFPSQTVAPGVDMTILRMTVGGH